MSSPLKISGRIDIGSGLAAYLPIDELLNRLASAIKEKGALKVETSGNSLRFKAGMNMRGSKYNVLYCITSALLEVEDTGTGRSLAYRPYFDQLVVMTAFISFLVGSYFFYISHSFLLIFLIVLAIFLLGVGGNIAQTAFRFPRFLRRTLK